MMLYMKSFLFCFIIIQTFLKNFFHHHRIYTLYNVVNSGDVIKTHEKFVFYSLFALDEIAYKREKNS